MTEDERAVRVQEAFDAYLREQRIHDIVLARDEPNERTLFATLTERLAAPIAYMGSMPIFDSTFVIGFVMTALGIVADRVLLHDASIWNVPTVLSMGACVLMLAAWLAAIVFPPKASGVNASSRVFFYIIACAVMPMAHVVNATIVDGWRVGLAMLAFSTVSAIVTIVLFWLLLAPMGYLVSALGHAVAILIWPLAFAVTRILTPRSRLAPISVLRGSFGSLFRKVFRRRLILALLGSSILSAIVAGTMASWLKGTSPSHLLLLSGVILLVTGLLAGYEARSIAHKLWSDSTSDACERLSRGDFCSGDSRLDEALANVSAPSDAGKLQGSRSFEALRVRFAAQYVVRTISVLAAVGLLVFATALLGMTVLAPTFSVTAGGFAAAGGVAILGIATGAWQLTSSTPVQQEHWEPFRAKAANWCAALRASRASST